MHECCGEYPDEALRHQATLCGRNSRSTITLAEELGLIVEPYAKVSDLLKLITNDKNYDEDFTKDCLEVITIERLEKRKDELEKREYELKKLELESKATISTEM
ncbi:hypothetical protein NPIL_497851 [Nephila pilipes]|uniref:Uncharacterized protein n=1 Tax=Nephila pilipes TaxID=299642 RepID=A0A8X6U711_NEPPI|nr:hypothetical protein NPIL_497851 [Nephila pilipes]